MQETVIKLSKQFRTRLVPAGLSAAAFLIGGCLQGPWEYHPEERQIHRGLWVTGYVIAGQPVRDFCIERLLPLDEEFTDAYRFYDSAEVSISGVFSGASQTMKLSPHPFHVNCFVGDSALLPEKGETYELSGWVAWDSSGTDVKTEISATTKIPTSFSIRDTAIAPALAITGMGADSGDTSAGAGSVLGLLSNLKPEAQSALFQKYQSALDSLAGESDSANAIFFSREMGNIIKILDKFKEEYKDGDSVFFLTGLSFALMSHTFTSYRSDDVGGVLVTQRYDSARYAYNDGIPPVFNVFEPGAADFFIPDSVRRLILYSKYELDDGYNVLDSMGFVQIWFQGGWNTIYFYGVDEVYADYVETAVLSETDTKVKSRYNVEGAKGVFTGAVLDSFKVYIKSDGSTDIYTKGETKIAYCNRGGSKKTNAWDKSLECRDYYPAYCKAVHWKRSDCLEDFFSAALALDMSPGALLDSLNRIDEMAVNALLANPDSARKLRDAGPFDPAPSLYAGRLLRYIDTLLDVESITPQEKDTLFKRLDSLGSNAKAFERAKPKGEYRFCVPRNFPDSIEACQIARDSCTGVLGENDCKKRLWQYCKDNLWQPAQCGLGLVSYCTDRKRQSELLCTNADTYCKNNKDEFLCRAQ